MADKATHQYKLNTMINCSKLTSCYTFVAMDSLIKTADNFQYSSAEVINQELFMEFMNKVAIWDYFGITTNH